VRGLTDRDTLSRFMRALGAAATADSRVYFTGGVTAVLLGWRDSTIDIDLELVPDHDELLRALATLKDRLQINVELAAPSHFIPALPGWEMRSLFITREGRLSFYHPSSRRCTATPRLTRVRFAPPSTRQRNEGNSPR